MDRRDKTRLNEVCDEVYNMQKSDTDVNTKRAIWQALVLVREKMGIPVPPVPREIFFATQKADRTG